MWREGSSPACPAKVALAQRPVRRSERLLGKMYRITISVASGGLFIISQYDITGTFPGPCRSTAHGVCLPLSRNGRLSPCRTCVPIGHSPINVTAVLIEEHLFDEDRFDSPETEHRRKRQTSDSGADSTRMRASFQIAPIWCAEIRRKGARRRWPTGKIFGCRIPAQARRSPALAARPSQVQF